MAIGSNASPEVFGFDFQVNATIFLLLDNIKDVKTIRMEGASEDIELTMNDGNQIIARGCVKLTVGYINFDEDDGASDGIEDSIDYEVEDVLNALKALISDLKEELGCEQKLANSIEECLKLKKE